MNEDIVDPGEITGGSIQENQETLEKISESMGSGSSQVLDLINNGSLVYGQLKDDVKLTKDEVPEDEDIDLDEVNSERDDAAKEQAKQVGKSGKGAINRQINAYKATIKVQMSGFMEEVKNLTTQVPAQLAAVLANPYTSGSVPLFIAQILATITALLCTAATIYTFATIIGLPMPKAFNETVIGLCEFKKLVKNF